MYSQSQYELAILLMGISICFFMALYFFMDSRDKRSPRKSPKRFLAGFMFIYGLTFANSFLERSGTINLAPNTSGLLVPSFFLLGPFLYFYVRDMCDAEAYILDKARYKHFILPVIALLLMLPYFIFPESLKLSILLEDSDIKKSGLFITGVIGLTLVQIILPVQILYYLLKSYRILMQYFTNLKQFFANIDDQNMDWLRILVLMLSVQWSMYAYEDLIGWPALWKNNIDLVTTIIDVAIMYFLSFKGLRHEAVLREEAALTPDADPQNSSAEVNEDDAGKETQKYAKSALNDEDSKRLLNKLRRVMEADKLYNDAMLSLRILSDHTMISTNYISQVINQELGCNFFDFVNGFRVEAAKEMLTSGEKKLAVLDIAHNVGFNSKSTFNTAFKKHTGLTPTDFRKQALGNI